MIFRQAGLGKIALPLDCGLWLQTCLSRIGQDTEAKPPASGGLQGAFFNAKQQARGSTCLPS